jgi:hypothetical protein
LTKLRASPPLFNTPMPSGAPRLSPTWKPPGSDFWYDVALVSVKSPISRSIVFETYHARRRS